MTGSQRENSPAQQPAHPSGKIEAQLDAALEDSFPASDPVSFVTSQMEDYWRADQNPESPPHKPPVAVGAPRRAKHAQRTQTIT